METLQLFPAPLTREAFAPFGHVIETDGAQRIEINEGTTERFHDLAAVDVKSEGGHPLINIFRGQPRPQPIDIRMVERHPLGSQAFIPMRNTSWLIVVAPPGEAPDPSQLRAFRAGGHQGVNYHAGVWHHPLLVLKPDHDFLVVDRGGPGDNCDEVWFEGAGARLAV
ncbi:MAG: ureidoglycolate lyase [Alphaproteobacteria bacterium]